MARRPGQKIPIKFITSKAARSIAFTKRRQGLFKKAFEFSVMTGANVATAVFSSSEKLFSFGHPSVDRVVNDFETKRVASSHSPCPPGFDIVSFVEKYTNVVQKVDEVKKQGKILGKEVEKKKNAIDGMKLTELEEAKSVKKNKMEDMVKYLEGLSLGGSQRSPSYASSSKLFDLNAYPSDEDTSDGLLDDDFP